MILVDPRAGSSDLTGRLLKLGVPAESLQMPFGDLSFIGRGKGGAPVPIGIEVKTLSDLMACLEDGRFTGHQLPGLIKEYDHVWLIVEGLWRYGDDGVLEIRKKDWESFGYGNKRWMAKDVEAFMLTLQLRGGITIHTSPSRIQTAWWISTLYHWWTKKDFDEHRSHLSFHVPFPDRALFHKPTLTRRIAKELDGIGWEKSAAVAEKFKTPKALVLANEEDWRQIPGIGKTLSVKIVKALRGL